jgi:site-specific recombinase XerD
LGDKYFGTHVLRHYAAMRMKQKKCSIKVISSILGHTTLQTTAIYAKVDIPALRTIAQDWPTEEVDHES